MKLFKKLSTLLAAAAMMLMTVTTTNAAEGQPSIKMNKENATFSAYRVLDAKQDENKTYVYSVNESFEGFFNNEKYGGYTFNPDRGISNGEKYIVDTDGDTVKKDGSSNRDSIQANLEVNKLTTQLQKFIDDQKALSETFTPAYTLSGNAKDAATDVKAGYYLILENGSSKTESNVITTTSRSIIVNVTKSVEISPKDDEFSVSKKIDEDGALIDKNSAHYGDIIKYEIQAGLPKADPKTTPEYVITDTLDGLYFNEAQMNLVVKSSSTNKNYVKDVDYTVEFKEKVGVEDPKENPRTMIIKFKYDSEAVRANSNAGDSVIITYDAVVAKDAKLNNIAGNPNKVEIKYDNTTIETNTITYVYELGLHKYGVKGSDNNKENLTPLGGVEFTLSDSTNTYTATTSENGTLTFKGLKAGTYTLKETIGHDGYAYLKEPITVVIADENTDGIPEITLKDVSSDYADLTDGEIAINVYNYEGISLPETGGMGTTMFMIGGAALVVLAGALLIVYSKKSKKA